MGPDIIQDFQSPAPQEEGIELYAPEFDTPPSVLQPLVDMSEKCDMMQDMHPMIYE